MCSTPNVEEPTQYQAAKEPEYSSGQRDDRSKRGRRGTILAPAGGDMDEGQISVSGKKVLLGG